MVLDATDSCPADSVVCDALGIVEAGRGLVRPGRLADYGAGIPQKVCFLQWLFPASSPPGDAGLFRRI